MPTDTSSRLREAALAGEILSIVYRGGSQPGSIREIAPIAIEGGNLRARCYNSNAVKTFRLDRIDISDLERNEAPPAPEWRAEYQSGNRFGSVRDIFGCYGQYFAELGWHVIVGYESLELFECFKNGNPRKTPTVSIEYSKTTISGASYDPAGVKIIHEQVSSRPWSVRSKGAVVRTFAKADRAVAAFLQHAEAQAPDGVEAKHRPVPPVTKPNPQLIRLPRSEDREEVTPSFSVEMPSAASERRLSDVKKPELSWWRRLLGLN